MFRHRHSQHAHSCTSTRPSACATLTLCVTMCPCHQEDPGVQFVPQSPRRPISAVDRIDQEDRVVVSIPAEKLDEFQMMVVEMLESNVILGKKVENTRREGLSLCVAGVHLVPVPFRTLVEPRKHKSNQHSDGSWLFWKEEEKGHSSSRIAWTHTKTESSRTLACSDWEHAFWSVPSRSCAEHSPSLKKMKKSSR